MLNVLKLLCLSSSNFRQFPSCFLRLRLLRLDHFKLEYKYETALVVLSFIRVNIIPLLQQKFIQKKKKMRIQMWLW